MRLRPFKLSSSHRHKMETSSPKTMEVRITGWSHRGHFKVKVFSGIHPPHIFSFVKNWRLYPLVGGYFPSLQDNQNGLSSGFGYWRWVTKSATMTLQYLDIPRKYIGGLSIYRVKAVFIYIKCTGVTVPNNPNAERTTRIAMIINITWIICAIGAGRGRNEMSH